MKSANKLFSFLLLGLVCGGCADQILVPLSSEAIVFGVDGSFRTFTKASEITDLDAFYVSAVTGPAGNESEVFASTQFAKVDESVPATYKSDKNWPTSDESYKFYASNVPLVFAATGTSVTATTATDVVVAYLAEGTYKAKNTLNFNHIFARLGKVTIIAEQDMTISEIEVRLTPKTGGTYNILTGEWSGLTTGSSTLVADAIGDNENDVWLVPGRYTLTASWTCIQSGGSVVRYSGKECQIDLFAGEVLSVGCMLGGAITCGVDIKNFTDSEYIRNCERLTFIALGDGDILWETNNNSWKKTIEYSKDNGQTWTSVTSSRAGTPIPVKQGDKVLIRGNNFAYSSENARYWCSFGGSVDYYVYGSLGDLLPEGFRGIMCEGAFCRLFQYDSYLFNHPTKDIVLPAIIMGKACYREMFFSCYNLTRAPELPAMTLAEDCYSGMFSSCCNLTRAPELPATTLAKQCYSGMFEVCNSLTTAPELPAMTLAKDCYSWMFCSCYNLTTAPELPATTLAEGCYRGMFSECTNLTTAPELPATTLAERCYSGMFSCCDNLTRAPELPAMTLAEDCYSWMFNSCRNLTRAPELPAMTLAKDCYSWMFSSCYNLTTAPELPATTLAEGCYSWMFSYCRNLTTAPELPATTLAERCYSDMFSCCDNLTRAPELPATTLAEGCYSAMYRECTKLNYVKCLATDISAEKCTSEWMKGVTSRGTFVKDASNNSWSTGKDGIPLGWTTVSE